MMDPDGGPSTKWPKISPGVSESGRAGRAARNRRQAGRRFTAEGTRLDAVVDRDERFEAEALPHMRSLYGTAYRMTRNAHDAEDLVQETFLRAYRAFDRFTPGTNIRAWLYTILHRVRTDAFRRAGRSPQHGGAGRARARRCPPPQDALARGGEDLERALAALPEVFRTAVILRDVEDFSYEEIARILAVPIGTVMSRIHRGRALLRQALGGSRP